jgi:hypothetical protein
MNTCTSSAGWTLEAMLELQVADYEARPIRSPVDYHFAVSWPGSDSY